MTENANKFARKHLFLREKNNRGNVTLRLDRIFYVKCFPLQGINITKTYPCLRAKLFAYSVVLGRMDTFIQKISKIRVTPFNFIHL